ncbi:MAG: tail fiber domain-containing protein [Spirochaetia bacterium]|nr:tail fiber domain-containing protein [Spirochaetia bacterium]
MYSGVSGNVGIGTNSPAYKLDIVGKLGLNDGGNSVFIGTGAGANDDGTTNANASIGYNSLNANTTGIGNVVLGATALSKNITGDYNVVLGYGAANYTTTFVNNESSSQSIFIGAITNPLAAGGQNEIIIGHDANGLGSNSVVLGNDSITKTVLKGSIGIGTTNPDSANLEIYDTSGYALYANGLTIGGVGTPSADDDAANKAYVDGLTGADTDWTISGSDMYSGVSGNVGIGTNSPVGKLHIKGADYPLAIFERTGATADVGYGNSRYLAVKTTDMSDGFGGGIIFSIQDNASAIEDIAKIYALRDGADNEGALIFRAGTSGDEEFMRISSTGNIGIGTTNPSYDLDISGNFRVTNSAYFDRTTYIKDANGTIDSWWGWYAWDKQFQFNKRSSANVFVQNIWAADWDTGDLMLVPTAGSVGVGESSLNSQTKVDINGSSTYGLLVNSDRIGEIGSVVEDTDAVNKAYVDDNFMPIGTSSGWALGGNDLTAKDYIGSNTNYDIGFETNNIERMTIDTDGNVGIGTSSPEGKLNVKSSEWPVVNIERTTTTGTTGFFSGMRLRTTTSASMADNFGGSFIFELNDTDTTGQNIVGRFGAVRHGADNSGSLVFQTTLNGTENERMRILSTGNVGIGTNNPTSLLTIANDNWISSINSAGTGGVNMFKVNSSDQIEVGSSLLIGPLEFAADSGMISFIDMPVTSSATSGTDEGYSFKIDGNNILTVFAESDGAGGITNSGVGIGTSAPTVALDVQLGSGHSILAGSMKIGNVATPVDGTDAVNKTYVDDAVSGASGSDTDWTESGSDIYRSSGNVGIGTTVPGKKLHINVTGDGDGVYINNSQTGQTAASAGFQLINDLGGQGAFVKIYSSNNTTNSALNNQLYVKNSIGGMSWVANTGSSIGFGIGTSISSANDLVIDSSGDVGIGTTDPSHNLVVYSSDQYTRTQINNSNSSGYAEILFENSGVATPSSWALRSEPSGKLAVIDYDNSLNPFAIERNTPSNTLYLDSTARIGVGTSTPEAGIHLVSSQSNEGLILQTTESTQGRIGFDLKTGYTSNVDDFFRFNFRGDLGDVILTTYDDSSDTWRQFLDFNYLDDDLFFGTNQKVTIKSSGNVGIGTTTPSEMLTVNGNVEADAYYYSSDERLKKNIETIDGAIETIKKLNPVSFNWRENDIASQGFIAQELEQVIPELVKTNSVNGLKAVQYANLTAVLTAGIQEQQKEIDYLKTMVEILKLRVNELESK